MVEEIALGAAMGDFDSLLAARPRVSKELLRQLELEGITSDGYDRLLRENPGEPAFGAIADELRALESEHEGGEEE